jgi:WD40 repeat protein
MNFATAAQAMSFSRDGKTLLVTAGPDLQIYDVATLKEVTPWDGHRGTVDRVAFSADGQQLFSGTAQFNLHLKEVIAWDMANLKRLKMTSNRTPIWPNIGVPSPEHTYYVGRDGDDRLKLYDFNTGKAVGRFTLPPQPQPTGKKAPAKSPAPPVGFFSPGSKFYVLNSRNEKGQNVARVYAVPSSKLLCEIPFIRMGGSDQRGQVVDFSANDQLVAAFETNGQINVSETATGKLRHHLGKTPEGPQQPRFGRMSLGSVAFSPDGRLLASWSSNEPFVRVWDMTTGRERFRLPPDNERHEQIQFAWSPDGRILAVGDRKIELWEVATAKIRREFTGHEGTVRSLAFSPDGRLLASGSTDTTMLIWDVWGR